MRETIRSFIINNFIFDEQKQLGDNEPLIGSGIIDSTGTLELISFLEKEFSIVFEDQELIGENFNSIDAIVSLLEKKISVR